MKIFSEFKELEGVEFNSVAACEEAEAKVVADREMKIAQSKKSELSKLRKQCADEVQKADDALAKAYEEYDKAKAEAEEIAKEANEKINAILTPANEAIRVAEKAKTDAIIKYNEHCGPYQKIYTGDKAIQEYNRMVSNINNHFGDFWNKFFNL